MNPRPAYFEPIRQRTADRWEQLESDPELAAPWRQLFKQVQSPRHVVSELLQNADDAGATQAIIRIEEDTFVFEHDGEDFTEEHFESLCRFGYSNKRALHTIGFRGIGFKSTFSLGDRVELLTPTLSVAFDRDRFTEPKWTNGCGRRDGFTTVRVVAPDPHKRDEVERSLQEWLESPVSLLFFKSIRRIQVGEDELHWGSCGPGPVKDTVWMALHEDAEDPYLIARSAPAPFPKEALAEIKEERMLGIDECADFPPCSVEIVLGAEGRLYVVLPTGVKTSLPFACNAPFIQDPSRNKIKSPGTSPTNRWLLARAGKLAADVMLQWLRQPDSNPAERAWAYGLMPNAECGDGSLDGVCGEIVRKAFAKVIQGEKLLLTEDGRLVAQRESVILPRPVLDAWPGAQATALFDDDGRPALSRHVLNCNRRNLLNWGLIEEIDLDGVLNVLRTKRLPKPEGWSRLLSLWAYIAPAVAGYGHIGGEENLRIVPVQGKDVLHAADETVRLGEKKLVPSEDDWRFLGDRLSVLSQNWLRFLTEKCRIAERDDNAKLVKQVNAAGAVLEAISLDEASDTGKIMARVAADFFQDKAKTLSDAVRIAQITAKLNANVSAAFCFVCKDCKLRPAKMTILVDDDGVLDLLLPEEWSESHLLHPDYLKAFTSCSREEWRQWISSGRSGLHDFVPLVRTRSGYRLSLDAAEREMKRRQFSGAFEHRYKDPLFHISDWDFEENIWRHWESIAEGDDTVWGGIMERILSGPQRFWSGSMTGTVVEESKNGHERYVVRAGLVPEWILKLRERNCLRDTHGVMRKPADLLRRTPETEALRDIEPFVDAHLDNQTTAPLLKLLGVGGAPTGPEKLLSRIKALSRTESPAVHELEKWYRRLDELIDNCSTDGFTTIRSAFKTDRLILTENETWETSADVFISTDEEDAPGAETVRFSVRDLTLWRKIGVEERPTLELAIRWLQGLSSGPLSKGDLRRTHSLLARHGACVWEECRHWLNLSNEWRPVEEFKYALTMLPLIQWKHLHPWVKGKTAYFLGLRVEIVQTAPFASIPLLAANVEERFHRKATDTDRPEQRGWLKRLGLELRRIKLADKEETDRIRELAGKLAETQWRTARDLEIIPYIEGKPAGTPRRVDAFWSEGVLYAEDKPLARLARVVSRELDRSFRNPEVTDAIKLCFERPESFVTEYMEEHFTLVPHREVAAKPLEDVKEASNVAVNGDETETVEDLQGSADDTQSKEEAHVREEGGGDATEADFHDGDKEKYGGGDEAVQNSHRKNRPHKPDIMERFALDQGFQKERDGHFHDGRGNRIFKSLGGLFPWEQRSVSGEVIRCYWPKEHCLQREALQIESEIWNMAEKNPDKYMLVLLNLDDSPVEITGATLREMRERGDLTVHPSTYRLVLKETTG